LLLNTDYIKGENDIRRIKTYNKLKEFDTFFKVKNLKL